MLHRSTRRRPARRPKPVAVALAVSLMVALLATVGAAPSSAYDKGSSLGDNVSFSDGSPAGDVKIDLYEAVNRWTRGGWLGSTSTNGNGHYSFDVADGCYITVAIAPIGAEFDFLGSGRMYDQQYGCVEGAPNDDFDSVLYRNDAKPEPTTTLPPTTQPPTTQPPTTQPPTTQPPTTQPPKTPPIRACQYTHFFVNQPNENFYIEIRDLIDYDDDAEVIYLDDAGNELSRIRVGDVINFRAGLRHQAGQWPYLVRFMSTQTRAISMQNPKEMASREITCARVEKVSPIGLDIDGSNAVERVNGEFAFDFDADGETESASEWFAPTEGILFDSRVEGPITGAHLFGDQGGLYVDGYQKLALLDANADGQVAGTELRGLALWTDANSNARLDAGEVSSLADHQVIGLSTSHTNFVSEAVLADGSTMMTEDLWFPGAAAGASRTNPLTLVGLGFAALALLGYTVIASRRRRDALDGELSELLDQERQARA